jgi:hypothetical protein
MRNYTQVSISLFHYQSTWRDICLGFTLRKEMFFYQWTIFYIFGWKEFKINRKLS